MVTSATREYVVTYIVQGFGRRCAGPYDTLDEARAHAADVAGYEGVIYVEVVPLAELVVVVDVSACRGCTSHRLN